MATSMRPAPAVFRLLLLIAVLLPLGPARAQPPPPPSPENDAQSLPPGEPPFLEEQLRNLPPGVELRPDGAIVKDGQVIAYAAIDSPERRKMRRLHEFSERWLPAFLYLDDYRLFAPYKLRDVATFLRKEERLTGLATASGSDVLTYAVTGRTGSRLVLRYLDEYRLPEQHVIADADEIGPDLWFGPLYASPNKQWVIVAVFPGRAECLAADEGDRPTSDWWLLDVAGQAPPRRVLADTTLLSASWSPNGSRAALEVQGKADDLAPPPAMFLLDTEAASVTQLEVPPGPSSWSPSGEAVFIAPRELDGTAVIGYDLTSGRAYPYASAAGRALWSPDFSRHVLLAARLHLGDGFGHSRLTPTDPGGHPLAWSSRAELLARRLLNNTLGFSVGAVETGAYDRLLAACPPAWTQPDPARPGLQKTMMDSMALDTVLSPVSLGPALPDFTAWAETADGPCFLWVEAGEEGQALRVLRFVTLTVESLGLDPRANLQEQMVAQAAEDAAGTLAYALQRYALDHDGRLPTAVGGTALEEALKPYLHDPHAFRSLFSPEEVSARILMPGANLRELDPAGQEALPRVARLSEGSLVYDIVAVAGGPATLAQIVGEESPLLPVALRAVRQGEPVE